MNILIVSFDKSLVKKLKEVLREYNVIDVKNGEEAINTVSSFIDVVIYDAVSGSISEEDINNMYRQKFKDSKYIVLVDDLFPVDMNNIIPPKKIRLMREEAADKIIDALLQEEGEEYKVQKEETLEVQTAFEEVQPPTIEDFGQILSGMMGEATLETPSEESITLSKLPFEEMGEESVIPPLGELGEKKEEVIIPPAAPSGGKKLMVVSFDTDIINKLKDALSSKVEILEARNVKQAMDKAREVDIILFDTISGMLAYRTLMDMSKDEVLRKKPYILLLDELFTIDADSIPLPQKYTFTREAELSKAIQKVLELIERAPTEQIIEVPKESMPIGQEETPELPVPIAHEEEEKDIMSLLEEIVGSSVGEVKEEIEEEKPTVEEGLQEFVPSQKEEAIVIPPQSKEAIPSIPSEALIEDLSKAIKDIIQAQLSQEKLYSIISQVINYEDLRVYISGSIERKMEDILRTQINEVLSKIDIAQILREEAYKVLKERLREIIT